MLLSSGPSIWLHLKILLHTYFVLKALHIQKLTSMLISDADLISSTISWIAFLCSANNRNKPKISISKICMMWVDNYRYQHKSSWSLSNHKYTDVKQKRFTFQLLAEQKTACLCLYECMASVKLPTLHKKLRLSLS